ncbi:MAG: carboxypeptidase regulatory-like domain-containing protein [Candidatus Magasanikbacteria bacterium]|nr:carboxypeptidase regulatory-like domain-containing protein [Candidatus Magasanikbacteria bacterium]
MLFRRYLSALLTLALVLLNSPLPAQAADIVVYEDGSDGDTAPWFIHPSGTTSVIQNIVDEDPAHDRVISLTASSPSVRMVFYAPANNTWQFPSFPILQWDYKYQSRANFLVMLKTDNTSINNGYLYLSYATDNTPGWRGNTFYYKLDLSLADGAWHTLTRNLQADVAAYAQGTTILGIQYFSSYGTGRIDNLALLKTVPLATVSGTVTDSQNNPLSGVAVGVAGNASVLTDATGRYGLPGLPPGNYQLVAQKQGYTFPNVAVTVDAAGTDVVANFSANAPLSSVIYEDGSDGDTNPWFIHPSGTTSVIQNIVDEDPAHGRVISLTASSPSVRMVFYAPANNPWQFPNFPVLQWDFKYQNQANFLIMLKTDYTDLNNGYLYLSYATNNIPGWRGNTLYYQIDPTVANSAWHTIARDLQQDVSAYSPNTRILGIQYFSAYGTGRLDNLLLRTAGGFSAGTLAQTTAADAPTGIVPDSATNLVLAKFLWQANGEDIKISSLNVSSTSGGSQDNALVNVRLKVDGSQVGSTIPMLTANGAPHNGWGSFGNSFILKAGATATVTIVADLTHTSIDAGEIITIALSAGYHNAYGMLSLGSINTAMQTGNPLTVRSGTVSLAMNTAFGDKSADNPTGTVNAAQIKVASFVITAGAGEDVEVSQITLADRTAYTCTGTYLQYLTLKDSTGKKLGQELNPATTCATVNTFTYNVSPAVSITNGGQYTVDVYADIKTTTLTATPLMNLTGVTATGKTTGASASLVGQTIRLQNVEISSSGAFMASVDSDSPVANNYLMGDINQTIAKFALQASSTEPIKITQFVVSARFSPGATGTMKNVRLVDDATDAQIGGTVSAFSDSVAGTAAATSTYSHATFTGLNLEVPKGATKKIKLVVDFTAFGELGAASTGQTVEPVILSAFNVGSITPFTAVGTQSGVSITPTVSFLTNANQYGLSRGAYAPTTTLYRAKLTVGWDANSPTGASSPNSAQIVGIFTIINKANVEGHTAMVQLMNFNFGTTISQAAGVGATRALTVYKDSVATANQLATTNYAATQTFASANSGNSALRDANFTDFQISSGASKTIYITLDTTDAATKTTTNPNPSLSVRIGSRQVTWGDGVSTNITAMGTDLPLQAKTLTY